MNKLLTKHMIKPEDSVGGFRDVDDEGDEDDEDEDERGSDDDGDGDYGNKRAKRNDGSSSTRKREPPAKKAKTKSGGSGRQQKESKLSPELAAVVGAPMMSRPQVVKALWAYIKANGLQNGQNITCDDKLRKIMGQDSVHMFTMNKLLSPHFIKDAPGESATDGAAKSEEYSEAEESGGENGEFDDEMKDAEDEEKKDAKDEGVKDEEMKDAKDEGVKEEVNGEVKEEEATKDG
ncbi:hypothetical protein HK104_004277 [Borealophlyctis nickersoniae]|nr:hypothetical protein HK104_004277 [Borealophlyctis nickersoniae]